MADATALLKAFPDLHYAVWQLEKSASGTPHYQGHLNFAKKKRITAVTKMFAPHKPHLEPAKDPKASFAYCKKHCDACYKGEACTNETKDHRLAGPWEIGTCPTTKGARSDLLACKETIDSGGTSNDLWQTHFATMARYHKSMSVYKRITTEPRDWVMNVVILWGPTGTGKTHAATHNYGDSFYMLPQAKGSGIYFDDYAGQDTIVVDEMEGNRMTYTFLKAFCDRYPMTLPVHGGAGHQMVSKTIVFTSNTDPRLWYSNEVVKDWDTSPFKRRVTSEIHMTEKYIAPKVISDDRIPIYPELVSPPSTPMKKRKRKIAADRPMKKANLTLGSDALLPQSSLPFTPAQFRACPDCGAHNIEQCVCAAMELSE